MLQKMVEHRRVDLLSHPVCLNYLQMKWQSYGFAFHSLNLSLYFLFVACLTWIVARLDPRFVFDSENQVHNFCIFPHFSILSFVAARGHFVLSTNTSKHLHSHEQWRDEHEFHEGDMDIWMFSSNRNMGQCVPMLMVAITLCLSIFKEFCQMYQQVGYCRGSL